MIRTRLTNCARRAHNPSMIGAAAKRAVMAMLGAGALGGCVQVEAPDEPIVIELNINITQEVIYRLAEDAGNTIDENAEIF